MRLFLALLTALLPACAALPEPRSLRPAGMSVYVEGGSGSFEGTGRGAHRQPGSDFSDVRGGVSFQFDLRYADDYEVVE